MNDEKLRDTLKSILIAEESLNEEKKGVNEERKAIMINIKESIREEDSAIDVRSELREYERKEGYAKVINDKIKSLKKAFLDCINGVGDYDKNQLSLFSVAGAKKEFEMGEIPEETNGPEIENVDSETIDKTFSEDEEFFGTEE